jgi:hypothetical protein
MIALPTFCPTRSLAPDRVGDPKKAGTQAHLPTLGEARRTLLTSCTYVGP